MYQPQYGVDNQMVAFTHASALAASLGRTLIAPPLQFPSACVPRGTAEPQCNSSALAWSAYFNTTAPDRTSANAAPRVRAIISSEPIPTFGAKSPVGLAGEQRLERVPLYTLSLQTAAHWLACNDETLYFDGLYTNKLPTDGWPAFSAAVLSAHREVQDHLGLQAPYTCLHLRNGDFAEACRKWQGQKWFESLDGKVCIYAMSSCLYYYCLYYCCLYYCCPGVLALPCGKDVYSTTLLSTTPLLHYSTTYYLLTRASSATFRRMSYPSSPTPREGWCSAGLLSTRAWSSDTAGRRAWMSPPPRASRYAYYGYAYYS